MIRQVFLPSISRDSTRLHAVHAVHAAPRGVRTHGVSKVFQQAELSAPFLNLSLLLVKWRFVGLKHCPAEAGQFRPVITGFRPSRQWRISLRALPAISLQGILPCNVSCLEIVRAYGPQELISPALQLLMSCIEICLWQMKLPLTRHLNPLESGLNCCV